MENPQSLNIEVQKPPIKPIIEYDESLKKENVPYTVNVDAEKCGLMLKELGISDSRITNIKIRLERKPFFPIRGKYNAPNDTIVIYTDPFWKKYSETGDGANKKTGQKIKEFLWTKTLQSDAADIKPNQTNEQVKRSLVGIFLHQSKHAKDVRGEKLKSLRFVLRLGVLGAITGAVGALDFSLIKLIPGDMVKYPLVGVASLFSYPLPFYFVIEPYEIRARRFARDNRNDPRWQNILTITPKPKQLV